VVLTILQRRAGSSGGFGAGAACLSFRAAAPYSLSTGGLDYGLVFGGSKTVLRGPRLQHQTVLRNVAGVYGAAGAGLRGWPRRPAAIVLTNQKGAVAGAVGLPDRPDGERGSERACDPRLR